MLQLFAGALGGRPATRDDTFIRDGILELAALDASRQFALHRYGLQATQIERLARELPLPQLQAPALSGAAIGPAELGQLADALGAGIGRLSPEVAGQ